MQRLGRNTNGYFGETLAIDEVLDQTLADARRLDWTVTHLDAGPGLRLAVLTRPPRIVSNRSPRIYVSAGIHGDEPAGPLAVRRLVAEDALPRDAWVWLCPCLNPTGFRRNTRETIDGLDLNRDYREPRSPEVRTHVAWLDSLPDFDLTVCLHEDWEAAGFYLYELNPENRPSLAPPTLKAVSAVCPIDSSPMIDGREARLGLISPNLDPATRPDWPEAFYLIQSKTRLSYTVESPSDYPLETRVQALAVATKTLLGSLTLPVG